MEDNTAYMKRRQFYILTTWVLIGLILMYAVFFTSLNDYKKISFFLDEYGVYEIDNYVLTTGYINDNHYAAGTQVWLGHDNEKYLRVTAEGIDNSEIKFSFIGGNYDNDGTLVPVCSIKNANIENGHNYYPLSSNEFSYAAFYIDGTDKRVIKGVQFRQSNKELNYTSTIPALLTTTILYVLISLTGLFFYKRYRRKLLFRPLQIPVLSLQIHQKNNVLEKSLLSLIVMLFTAVITSSYLLNMYVGEKGYYSLFKKYIFFQLVLVLLLSLLMFCQTCRENKIHIDTWSLVICTLLSTYLLISDILVDKVYRFSGISIFIVLLIYVLVWNSRRENEQFIKTFEQAVHCFFIISLILLLIYKDEVPDGRYSGSLTNQSIYALYLGGIWAILIGSFESSICNNNVIYKKATTATEMLIVLVLAISTQAFTPMIAIAAITVLFVYRMISKKRGRITAIKLILIAITLIVIALILAAFILLNLRGSTNYRLINKFTSGSLSVFLSNRDYYWREYLRHMNLFGHEVRPYLWDHRIYPHNAIIGMMYWYGVPCVVPYILMMIIAVEKSWRYANTGLKHASVPFYSIASFIIMSMADNVEQPFVWLPWIACYLLMAPILLMPVEEIEALKTERSEAK